MYQKIRLAVYAFSLIIFPITFYYFSPALPLMGAAEGVVSGSLMLFFMLFISAVFAGRVFCSWICPAGAIQELTLKSRNSRISVKKISWIKYLVWAPWLILVIFLFRRSGGIESYDFFYQTTNGISLTRFADTIIYGIIIVIFFGLSLIFGRRAACHTICWMSPFMILGRKLGLSLGVPSLKLKTEPASCVSCNRCTSICPMSLPVSDMIESGRINDVNCILCGQCIDICGKNTIEFIWEGTLEN